MCEPIKPDNPDGVLTTETVETYITGVGQRLRNLHSPEDCAGRACVIHNPSDHHLRSWPTLFRLGDQFDVKPRHMERVCEHGVGHPDPDDAAYLASQDVDVRTHGCDGCCERAKAAHDESEYPLADRSTFRLHRHDSVHIQLAEDGAFAVVASVRIEWDDDSVKITVARYDEAVTGPVEYVVQ